MLFVGVCLCSVIIFYINAVEKLSLCVCGSEYFISLLRLKKFFNKIGTKTERIARPSVTLGVNSRGITRNLISRRSFHHDARYESQI